MTDTSTTDSGGLFSGTDIASLTKQAISSSDTSDLESQIAKVKKLDRAKSADPDVIAARDDATRTMKADRAGVDDAFAKVEPFKPLPPPQQRQTDPIQAFGSFGSMFAILASGFTHQPAINSMNAAASAINAAKANDAEAYKTAYDAWKENTQLALDRHKLQHEDYQDALEKWKTDPAMGDALMKAAAAKYDDQVTMALTEAGLDEKLSQIHDSRQKAALGMLEHMPAIEEGHQKVQAYMEYQDAIKSGDPAKIQAAKDKARALAETFHGTAASYSGSVTKEKAQAIEDLVAQGMSREDAIAKVERDGSANSLGKEQATAVEDLVKDGMSRVDAIAKVKAAGSSDSLSKQEAKTVQELVDGGMSRLAAIAKVKDAGSANSMGKEQAAAVDELVRDGMSRVDAIQKVKDGNGPPQSPEEKAAVASQAATGMPLNQVVPGYGNSAIKARQVAHADAIKKIMDDTGMSAEQAGVELANRTIAFQSGKSSEGQLTKMLGATRAAVDQLDFNIEKTKEEMKKVKSTDLSPVLNAIARGEEKWTGDPAYSSLFFYLSATANESARILSGGQASVAQLHDGAMREAKEWVNINMTPASFNAVANAMKAEGKNRIENYEKAIQSQSIGGGKSGVLRYDASGNRIQ